MEDDISRWFIVPFLIGFSKDLKSFALENISCDYNFPLARLGNSVTGATDMGKVFRCRVESSSSAKAKDNSVANIRGFCCTSHRSKVDVKIRFTLRPLTMDSFLICIANVIILKEV
jgi:hypothetical protein